MRKGLLTKVKRIEQQRAKAAASAKALLCPACTHLSQGPGLPPDGCAFFVGMGEKDYLFCKHCGASYEVEHSRTPEGWLRIDKAVPAVMPFP